MRRPLTFDQAHAKAYPSDDRLSECAAVLARVYVPGILKSVLDRATKQPHALSAENVLASGVAFGIAFAVRAGLERNDVLALANEARASAEENSQK